MTRVRVLVVDDSALVREMLTAMLSSDPAIEVVGTAADAQIARRKITQLDPDVVTLDVEMPGMDGITFLEKIMRLRPMPVVMVSSLTQEGAEVTLRALELGAVDVVAKPTSDLADRLHEKRDELVAKVREAALARIRPMSERVVRRLPPLAQPGPAGLVVAVGASTGGVEALTEILGALPEDSPPLLICQHMPAGFTASFARRLDRISALTVVEATDGEAVRPGHAYIAPGNRHLLLARVGSGLICRLENGPAVSGHRPSVDALFHSVAEAAPGRAVGVILTGMGRDGAAGLKALREAGAHTIGQDAATCIVHGMPAAAASLGAVAVELPLAEIAAEILRAPARLRIERSA